MALKSHAICQTSGTQQLTGDGRLLTEQRLSRPEYDDAQQAFGLGDQPEEVLRVALEELAGGWQEYRAEDLLL